MDSFQLLNIRYTKCTFTGYTLANINNPFDRHIKLRGKFALGDKDENGKLECIFTPDEKSLALLNDIDTFLQTKLKEYGRNDTLQSICTVYSSQSSQNTILSFNDDKIIRFSTNSEKKVYFTEKSDRFLKTDHIIRRVENIKDAFGKLFRDHSEILCDIFIQIYFSLPINEIYDVNKVFARNIIINTFE